MESELELGTHWTGTSFLPFMLSVQLRVQRGLMGPPAW